MKSGNHSAKTRHGKDRNGLTAVELLAATLLASFLMVAVLGVLESMTRGRRALLEHGGTAAWQMRLAEQLQWDLANSRTIQSTKDGIELTGFAGRSFSSGAALHIPAVIRYEIIPMKGNSCLVRSETHPDATTLENEKIALVAMDIEKILIASGSGIEVNAGQLPLSGSSLADGPLPGRVVVALFAPDQEKPEFHRAFLLR